MFQLFWAMGSCFIVFISIFVMPTLGWRYLLIIASIPVLIFSLSCAVSIFDDHLTLSNIGHTLF